ncbi:MAG TPA: hypothetical protein PK765_06550 [bacterium]|nr:hypothetical protein [bacterium]
MRYAGLCATALVLAWLIPLEWMRYSVFALGIFAGAIYIIYHHKKLKQCHDLSQERDVERLQKEQRESEDNLKKTQEQKRVLKILIENEQKYVDYNKRFDPERFAELKERRSSTDRKKEKIDGYIGAYKDFRNQLERTQEKQIESLTRGLTEDIVEIYNAIQFREKHKIKSISFPNQNNSRIQIEYIVQPGRSICASKNMSDGTLRILAFAILMAKVRSLH